MNQGHGGNQGNRGYEGNNHGHNQGQQYPSSSNMQYNYTMNQPYAANMANMGYQEQYYPQQEAYGSYGDETYEEADYDNLDEIDREMNRGASNDYEAEMMRELEGMQQQQSPSAYTQRQHQGHQSHAPSSGPFVPQSAVPSQNGKLSAHAHEFWFPECRNCPCCKGFKHGCECCKPGVADTCTNASCIDGVFESQVNAELATRSANAPPAPAPVAAAAANTKPAGYAVTPPSAGAAEFCKYEKLPGGCRFGAGCRFVHSAAPSSGAGFGGSNAYPPAAPSSGKAKCSFFARGSCTYGDNCRFAHY